MAEHPNAGLLREAISTFNRGDFDAYREYATNPLWLLAADLHRSFAQAQKACTHESVLHNAQCLEASND